jgi:hypothetical protein
MSAISVLAAAVSELAMALKPLGFRRRGFKLVRTGDEVVSLIEFQPSQQKTTQALTYVVNYGVVVPSLFLGGDLRRPEYTQCHWGGRVSGRDGKEAWWPVRENDVLEQVTARLKDVVDRDVLPALEGKQREADLIALWKAGRGPLLVEAQRLQFLAQLLHRAGRQHELAEVRAELERKAVNPFAIRALEKVRALGG